MLPRLFPNFRRLIEMCHPRREASELTFLATEGSEFQTSDKVNISMQFDNIPQIFLSLHHTEASLSKITTQLTNRYTQIYQNCVINNKLFPLIRYVFILQHVLNIIASFQNF